MNELQELIASIEAHQEQDTSALLAWSDLPIVEEVQPRPTGLARISNFRLVVRALLIVAILFAAKGSFDTWQQNRQGHDAGIIDRTLSASATTPELATWKGRYPLARVIRHSTVNKSKNLKGQQGLYVYASTAINDQSITVNPIVAKLPVATQVNTIRHEYGHAAMNDFIVAKTTNGDYNNLFTRMLEVSTQQLTQQDDAAKCPVYLRPAFEDFKAAKANIYGGTIGIPNYFTKSFGEFYAQSFAEYVAGRPIAARTFQVIQEMEQLK